MDKFEWVTSLFPKPGYFVEAGAHDGVGDSQTKALEDIGWTGICVEPSSAFAGLKASRKCKVDNRCLWWYDDDGGVPFWEVNGNGIELSGIASTFCDHWDRSGGKMLPKPTVTLPTLLRDHHAPKTIEFFSLDTEGSEHRILLGHDFDLYRFLTITVEHNGVEKQQSLIRELLISQGYKLDRTNSIEDWYIHESLRQGVADGLGH